MTIYLGGRNRSTSLVANSEVSLSSFLENSGLAAEGIADSKCTFVCLDIDRESIRFIRKNRVSKERAILIRQEPRVVCPENYRKIFTSKFGTVIDVGRVTSDESQTVPWPQTWPDEIIPADLSFKSHGQRVVMVNADKLSFIKGELYSLRRIASTCLPLDIFGRGWNAHWRHKARLAVAEVYIALRNLHFPHLRALRYWFHNQGAYMGPTEDKIEKMSEYRYALVIENDASFVSEKLFDSIFAGCIPIYVGPRLDSLNLPKGLVIMSAPTRLDLIQSFVLAREVDFETWSQARNEFLSKPEFRVRHASENVFRLLAGVILGENRKVI